MASLASSIISTAQDLLKISDTTGVPAVTTPRLLTILDYANREFIEAPYNGSNTGWDFMRQEYGITFLGDTTLTAAVATTDTTLTVSSNTNFTSTGGACVLWTSGTPDTVLYTGKSATTTVTGVTGIGYAHNSGDGVQFLYQLPANYFRVRNEKGYIDGVMANGVSYTYISGIPGSSTYSIYDDGTNKHLWFPRGTSGFATIIYDKAATTISSSSTTVDVPPRFEEFLVYRLVQHGTTVLGYDPNEIAMAKMKADTVLANAMKQKHIGKKVSTVWSNYPRRVLLNGKAYFVQ